MTRGVGLAGRVWAKAQDAWRQVVAVHPGVKDPDVRQSASITANLAAVSFFAILLGSIAVPLLVRPGVLLWQDPLFRSGTLLAALMVVCLGLARSSQPALGIHGLPWSIFVSDWALIANSAGTPWAGASDFLLVAPALAAITLRPRATLLLWLATLAAFVAYLVIQPDAASTEPEAHAVTLMLVALLPPILIFGQSLRDRQSRVIGQQQERLQHQEADLRGLLDSAPNGTLAVDGKGSIVFVNQQACRLFGYEHDDLLGRSVDLLVPDEVRGQHAGHRAAFAAAPGPRQMGQQRDLFGRRKDGSLVPLEIGLNPMVSSSGGQVVVASFVDLTARKRTEALQAEAVRRDAELHKAAAVAAFRADLMNLVAHELKNPLTPLKLQVHVLGLQAGALPDKAKRALEVLARNTDRLQQQIDHMLEASRLESGTVKLARARIDVAKIVQDAADSYAPVAAEAGLAFGRVVQGPLLADGDAARLAQALDNLLSNAIKYTAAGSVEVAAQREGGRIVVRVRDTGLGLSQVQVEKLFQPFSRVHEPVRKTMTSTGLGLFITKGIVELHAGRMGVESAGPGQGSTFSFDLPAAA